ncbi:molybdate transport system ATP-binding protein [Marisediminitalea aggregata]|uniref:Molybdate transport system ATP-binding protein n=1 Tax=Marisediminitalea aggregata TaxID=634436 RepID=A0A1M5LLK1_9ALTE|nr:molybdate ABC transporter ATP-binding protein ModF [Marisediminitalea aggregata]SHG65941.1 molybdate transport system ATP-binding protein [Marisediminitalea aggregata]
MSIHLSDCQVKLAPSFSFSVPSLRITEGQHLVITGFNGSGKSSLAAVIAGVGELQSGSRNVPDSMGWVSVAQQQAIIDAERKKDDADILDVVPTPSTARQIALQHNDEPNDVQRQALTELAELLCITALLDRAFLSLSTGETRKVLLLQQLLDAPDWLILDEPYDGLDVESVDRLAEYLDGLAKRCTMILVINRLSELPQWAGKLVFMQNNQISWQSEGDSLTDGDRGHIKQILHIQHQVSALPPADSDNRAPVLADRDAPLVKLVNGNVTWGDNTVFDALNWEIYPGQHWQISGPNGSGKTCLLTLITGDNPLCYRNDLTVFGYKRGSGESIWDIKQHLGIVSNSLHLQYRVNCSLLDVILSGYYDSIGLYQQPTLAQRKLATAWLETIDMSAQAKTPFQSLSFGDQRLALIARAMVKHPSLLILDEPCNGLDDANRVKILAMVNLLARQGDTTLLYVNHHTEDRIDAIEHCLDMRDFAIT